MGLYDRSRKSQVLFKSFACRSTSPTKCVGQELQNREFDAMGTQMGDRLHSLSLSIAEHKKELEQFTSAQMPAKLEVSSKQTAINFHNDLVGLGRCRLPRSSYDFACYKRCGAAMRIGGQTSSKKTRFA